MTPSKIYNYCIIKNKLVLPRKSIGNKNSDLSVQGNKKKNMQNRYTDGLLFDLWYMLLKTRNLTFNKGPD